MLSFPSRICVTGRAGSPLVPFGVRPRRHTHKHHPPGADYLPESADYGYASPDTAIRYAKYRQKLGRSLLAFSGNTEYAPHPPACCRQGREEP